MSIGNDGKKTISKLNFQMLIALEEFFNNNSYVKLISDAEKDFACKKKENTWDIFEVKTNESKMKVDFNEKLKKALIDLVNIRYINSSLYEVFLYHTNIIEYKKHETIDGQRVPEVFRNFKLNKKSINIDPSKEMPMYKKTRIPWDEKGEYENEIKKMLASYARENFHLSGSNVKDFVDITTKFILSISIVLFDASEMENKDLDGLSDVHFLSKADIDNRLKVVNSKNSNEIFRECLIHFAFPTDKLDWAVSIFRTHLRMLEMEADLKLYDFSNIEMELYKKSYDRFMEYTGGEHEI